MFNLGAPEVLTILLLALIVLGPTRLPDAAKQVGKFMAEMRKLSTGFQDELKSAFDDETEAAARQRGAAATPDPARSDAEPVVPMPPAPEAAPTPAPPRRRRTEPLRAPASKPER